MISIRNVNLHYGKSQVIYDLSLSISEGEKVAIIGPSGAGKSSLLHHLYQLNSSQAALCSQNHGLVDNLSLFHNIYMGALARHNWLYNLANIAKPFKQHLTAIEDLCEYLELDIPLSKKVDQLSGGQRQRVALGRAIYQQQPLFIGDEPFSALDPLMASRLLNSVFKLHETVIMVVHDRELALSAFDRVIALNNGRLVLDSQSQKFDKNTVTQLYQSNSVA